MLILLNLSLIPLNLHLYFTSLDIFGSSNSQEMALRAPRSQCDVRNFREDSSLMRSAFLGLFLRFIDFI